MIGVTSSYIYRLTWSFLRLQGAEVLFVTMLLLVYFPLQLVWRGLKAVLPSSLLQQISVHVLLNHSKFFQAGLKVPSSAPTAMEYLELTPYFTTSFLPKTRDT